MDKLDQVANIIGISMIILGIAAIILPIIFYYLWKD